MSRITKGDFGYLEKQAHRELVWTLILFAASFGVLLIGILIAGTKNNLLTIVAVLGLLPASKELITSIMFTRAKKHGCPQALYDAVQEGADPDGEAPLLVVYDLYMTAQENDYPILSMCCHNKTLIGVAVWEKFDYKKAQEHIQIMLKQNGHKNVAVKIFSEQEKYINRMRELKEQKAENTKADQDILRLMLNLSL